MSPKNYYAATRAVGWTLGVLSFIGYVVIGIMLLGPGDVFLGIGIFTALLAHYFAVSVSAYSQQAPRIYQHEINEQHFHNALAEFASFYEDLSSEISPERQKEMEAMLARINGRLSGTHLMPPILSDGWEDLE